MEKIIIPTGALINIEGVIHQCVLDVKGKTCNACSLNESINCATHSCASSNRNYTGSIHFEELDAIIY